MILNKEKILEDINKNIPKDINWSGGAKSYLNKLVEAGGKSYEMWHYTKPFLSEPLDGTPLHGAKKPYPAEFSTFFQEMYLFLNVLEKLNLPPKSKIIDVACGPGWTTHYLGKLGHSVLGIDISDSMIEIAKKRLYSDPYPPYPLESFNVNFLVHNIESSKLQTNEIFDIALFDSALHHFYNPIAVLENLSNNLGDQSVIVIIEGASPENGEIDPVHREIMNKYHTLERPYTRKQLEDILNICGFTNKIFYNSINGLIQQEADIHEIDNLSIKGMNLVFASKDGNSLKRISPLFFSSELEFHGFYDKEFNEGKEFRWSKPESILNIMNFKYIKLKIESYFPNITKKNQKVFIFIDEKKYAELDLTLEKNYFILEFDNLSKASQIKFFSDSAFIPKIYGINQDSRLLSFFIEVIEQH